MIRNLRKKANGITLLEALKKATSMDVKETPKYPTEKDGDHSQSVAKAYLESSENLVETEEK